MKSIWLVLIFLLVSLIIFGTYKMFQRAEVSRQMTPELGLINGQLIVCPDSPNCVSSFANTEEHSITPLSGGILQLNALAAHIAAASDAEILVLTENYLHATYQSGFFGFVDDLELYFDGSQIQVRSASREGHSDLGANRKRVENLRTLL